MRDLRLLIGNTSNRETLEQIAEGYRRLEQVADAAEALAYPTPISTPDRGRARPRTSSAQPSSHGPERRRRAAWWPTLVRLIEDSGCLKVKVYTMGRLHAKAYIFDYGPVYDAAGRRSTATNRASPIVGSSNFTLSGYRHNTELNVVVHGNDNHAELTALVRGALGRGRRTSTRS